MKTPKPAPTPPTRPVSRGFDATAPAVVLSLLAGSVSLRGQEPDLSKLPPPAGREVSFATDIQPLLDRSCLRCHGATKPKGGLRLDNQASAMKGGDEGAVIVPGDSAHSRMVQFVSRIIPESEMPPEGKGDPLTPAEVGLIRAWIDQGAKWSDAGSVLQFDASVTPAMQFIWVSGNAARFREQTGLREGWGGGASDFSIRYDSDPRTHVQMDGRAMVGPDEYRFNSRVTRDDLGWFRLRYRQFSSYHDDTGGYYAPFGTPAPQLGEDLVVRHRYATAEFGLEIPDWPKVRLAYDLALRDGSEDTLNWGGISQQYGPNKNIFPGRKRIDETTHLLTLDIAYDWDGLQISDQAQFEWHAQDNRKTNYEFTSADFSFATRSRDQQDYWRGANVLRLERSLRDWLYLSGGYLYSHLQDHGGFSVESFVPTDPTVPPSLDRNTDQLTLRRQSHVINGNAMLGPWEHLHFYAGLQAEWTRQEGFATGQTFSQANLFDANVDRAATDESFGLRYSGLPMTVLFAEARFQQESFSHFEEGLTDGAQEFLRDTDAEGDTKDYEAGFTVAPWRSVSFTAKYRHRDRQNDYDHPRDIDVFSSGNGYPAFILARDTVGDEVEARLVVQPLRWLKTTLRYGYSTTDFKTTTEQWTDTAQDPPVNILGGQILAGEYDAHSISAGLVLTPWSRLYFSTTVGWVDSVSRSGINNDAQVVPYKGDTWNLLTSATYIVDEKTDLLATYLFSTADFTQNNADAGLPLGIAYTRHAATAGIARRMKHDRTLRLEYGYFTYDEPTLGGAADYTAHAIFASFRIPWK